MSRLIFLLVNHSNMWVQDISIRELIATMCRCIACFGIAWLAFKAVIICSKEEQK